MIVKSRAISNAAMALVLAASLSAAPLSAASAQDSSATETAESQTSTDAKTKTQAPTTVTIEDYDWDGTEKTNAAIVEAAIAAEVEGHKTVKQFLSGEAVATEDFMAIDAKALKTIDADFAKLVSDAQTEIQALIDAESQTAGTVVDTTTLVENSVDANKDTVKDQATETATTVEEAPEDTVAEREDLDEDEIVYISRNLTTEQFIETIGEDARELCQEADLYASVMIAQAIVESASGSSGLSCEPYNNLFGIKGSYKGSSVRMKTQEDDGQGNYSTITAEFRKYPSLKDSLSDYVDLLKSNSLYANAFKSKCESYEDACDWLQGRYATSTTYAKTLKAYIEAYNLTEYDSASDTPTLEKVSVSPTLSTTSSKTSTFGTDVSDLGVVVPEDGLPSSGMSPIVAGLLASGAALLIGAVGFFIYWRRKVENECETIGLHGDEFYDDGIQAEDKSGISAKLKAIQDEAQASTDKAAHGKHAGAEKSASESATTGSLPPLKFVDNDF